MATGPGVRRDVDRDDRHLGGCRRLQNRSRGGAVEWRENEALGAQRDRVLHPGDLFRCVELGVERLQEIDALRLRFVHNVFVVGGPERRRQRGEIDGDFWRVGGRGADGERAERGGRQRGQNKGALRLHVLFPPNFFNAVFVRRRSGDGQATVRHSGARGAAAVGAKRPWRIAALEPWNCPASQHALCARCKQIPSTREALEFVRSALRESQPGPCHEVRDNSGNKNFVGLRERHDACRRVHGYSANIATSNFDFASMEAGASLQANLSRRRAKSQRAANCAARSIEPRQKTVASRLNENTMLCDGLNCQLVVTVQQSSPGLVAYRGGAAGGINDIGKQHRGEMR